MARPDSASKGDGSGLSDVVHTERSVRDLLLRAFPPHQSIVGVNVCGIGPYPHEMDFFRVTRSGNGIEYEIKVTAADIKAEMDKTVKYADLERGSERIAKHRTWNGPTLEAMLPNVEALPDQIGPSYIPTDGRYCRLECICARVLRPIRQFWVVTPTEDLAALAASTLPAFVGVAVARDRFWFTEVRKASPLPHSRKLNDAERLSLLGRTYHRYWSVMLGKIGRGAGRGVGAAEIARLREGVDV